jgi:hypothetical protein
MGDLESGVGRSTVPSRPELFPGLEAEAKRSGADSFPLFDLESGFEDDFSLSNFSFFSPFLLFNLSHKFVKIQCTGDEKS